MHIQIEFSIAIDSLLTEEEVSCGKCSWTYKKVVEGNAEKSSPEIQREDGWVLETCVIKQPMRENLAA